jgi:hypothetical protein
MHRQSRQGTRPDSQRCHNSLNEDRRRWRVASRLVLFWCVGSLDFPFCISDSSHHKGTIRGLQIAAIEHNRAAIARFRARLAEEKGGGSLDLHGKLPLVRFHIAMVTISSYAGTSYSSLLESSTRELETLQDL